MNIKVIYGKMLVTMSHVFGVDFAKKFDTGCDSTGLSI